MIGQALKIVLKEYDGPYSRTDFLPYAIWHNQKTGQVTIHTETGYYKFPAEVVERIEFIQLTLPFDSIADSTPVPMVMISLETGQ
jgi:hypothetical protein